MLPTDLVYQGPCDAASTALLVDAQMRQAHTLARNLVERISNELPIDMCR